ncbi:MAG: DUF2061 domain-containing protein [Bdellovibrionales bacterium]
MPIKRTLLKTLSYAIMHMAGAITVAYVLSGSWKVALAIGLIEPVVQTVLFFFHERIWHKIDAPGKDHHNAVTDSVSPITRAVDVFLHKHPH